MEARAVEEIVAAHLAGDTTVIYAGQAAGTVHLRRSAAAITADLGTQAEQLLRRWTR